MNLTPERKIAWGFALAFVILVVNGIASFHAASVLVDNERSVVQAHEVLSELEATLSTLKDAETGQRGYLITGEEDYLTPYKLALTEIDSHLNRLKTLTQGNADQMQRFTLLQTAVGEKLDELGKTVLLRRQGGFDAARAMVLTNAGKNAMDDCRDIASQMEKVDYKELAVRDQKSASSTRTMMLTFWAATLLALAFLGLVYVMTRRSFAERMQSEAKVNEQREWLRVTLASIGDAVIATDNQGKVSFMNPVAESLTGWSQQEAATMPMTRVFHIVNEFTREEVDSPVTRVLAEGVVVGLANHTLLIDKHGHETPIDDSGAPIKDAAGKLSGVVLVFRDVSGRRQTEREREDLLSREQAARRESEQARQLSLELLDRERQSRNEAEAANRSKDEFLATVSHELRTPLNAVIGWAKLLGAGTLDGTSSERALETIQRNARFQAQLIDDLLDVSRIVSGKLRLDVGPVEMGEVIIAAVDSIRPAAEAKAIVVHVTTDADARMVSGDRDRLQQIVWNLVSNAVKFTRKGGVVEVRLERIGSQVGVVVADTGAGISHEFLPFVFERFRQGDSSLTRRHGGLGLGLAIVRHLVELHGGTVRVDSPGEELGSTFTVLLPMLAVHAGEPDGNGDRVTQSFFGAGPASDRHIRLDGLNILVVDDEADAREMIAIMLGQCGASVTSATSVWEALEAIEKSIPDLLISDIEMPEQDGYSLISKVRSLPGQAGRLAALALTAHARTKDRIHALQAGFDGHLAKPVELVELVTVTMTLTRRAHGLAQGGPNPRQITA